MKQIILGKGNILISTTPNSLVFRQLKNSYKIGDVIDFSTAEFSQVIQLNLRNYFELKEFKDLVKNSYQLKTFEFQNIKFDFTQYSRDSVDVLLDQINWVEKFIPKSIAC